MEWMAWPQRKRLVVKKKNTNEDNIKKIEIKLNWFLNQNIWKEQWPKHYLFNEEFVCFGSKVFTSVHTDCGHGLTKRVDHVRANFDHFW
jgi:hypothetical protein